MSGRTALELPHGSRLSTAGAAASPTDSPILSQPQSARREFLRAGGSLFLIAASSPLFAQGAAIIAVRVWPSPDYTRVTLEVEAPLKTSHQLLKNPDRLVLDIEDLELSGKLRDLVSKVNPNDPYIASVRAGQFKPRVVRLVFDLKTEVNPQVFALRPVGEYGHRLVLDLHPAVPNDPLMALLERRPDPSQPAAPSSPAARAEGEPGRESTRPEAREEARPARPGVTRLITIALDPGHGGEDPGAIGKRGTYEKHVTLAVAKRLKEKIEAEPNMRVMLTRDGDFFVPLGVRVQKARRVQADLFVSIHADAWIKPTARGSSVFALSEKGATSSAAGWLAKKENDADLIGGVNLGTHDRDLARVLLDLSTTAQINDSLKLGRAVLAELGNINELHKAHVEQAGFAVLRAPDIPSILVETAFISNPEEEKRLNDEAYQDKMATSIMRGIRAYLAKNPPLAKSRMASLQ